MVIILSMVLICIAAGVILGLLRWLFDVISNRNTKIKDHFDKHKSRYLTIVGVIVIIAAAVYMANSTSDDDDNGIVQYDNRGNPLDN